MGKGRLDGRWKRGREGDGRWSAQCKQRGENGIGKTVKQCVERKGRRWVRRTKERKG